MTIKELLHNIEEDNVERLEDFGSQRSSHAAHHAIVFTVSGLLETWKQALGYVLSSGPIRGDLLKLLLTVLGKILEIGFKMKNLVFVIREKGRYGDNIYSWLYTNIQRTLCPECKEMITGRQQGRVRENLMSIKQVLTQTMGSSPKTQPEELKLY